MPLKLIKIDENSNKEIYEMLQEIPYEENGFINSMNGKPPADFASWLQSACADSEQATIIDGWKVPQTIYWLFDDEKPIGFGKVRHFLTDRLLEDGGNIGYTIRPAQRGKGYGTLLLGLLLGKCPELGISKALLTVNISNIPSQRVCLSNGGVITKQTDTLAYIWIDCLY